MSKNINQAFQENNDFEKAKEFLKEKGELKTQQLSNGNFKVEIEIDGEIYSEENEDSKLAIIRLSNNI